MFIHDRFYAIFDDETQSWQVHGEISGKYNSFPADEEEAVELAEALNDSDYQRTMDALDID